MSIVSFCSPALANTVGDSLQYRCSLPRPCSPKALVTIRWATAQSVLGRSFTGWINSGTRYRKRRLIHIIQCKKIHSQTTTEQPKDYDITSVLFHVATGSNKLSESLTCRSHGLAFGFFTPISQRSCFQQGMADGEGVGRCR